MHVSPPFAVHDRHPIHDRGSRAREKEPVRLSRGWLFRPPGDMSAHWGEARTVRKKKKSSVGIVGLGIMGSAFAHNLIESGWHVVGYDIDPKRRRALARAGVEIVRDPGEVAA